MKRFASILVAVALAGCAAMGPAGQTKDFNARAADVLQGTDEIVTSTRTLLAADLVSPDNAINIGNMAKLVKEGVVIAAGLQAKDCPDPKVTACVSAKGTARLRMAASALDAMKVYVATPGAK